MINYRDVRISGLDFQLGEGPNVVGELDRLIDHILTLQVPLRHGEDVVLVHLSGHSIYRQKIVIKNK